MASSSLICDADILTRDILVHHDPHEKLRSTQDVENAQPTKRSRAGSNVVSARLPFRVARDLSIAAFHAMTLSAALPWVFR